MVFQLQLCLANCGRDNILHSMVGWCRQPAHLNCTVLGRTTISVTRDVVSLCVVSHLQSASVVRFCNLLILTNSNTSVSSISYAASWEVFCLPKFPAPGSPWSTQISLSSQLYSEFFSLQATLVSMIITPARMSCVTDVVARHAQTSTLLLV